MKKAMLIPVQTCIKLIYITDVQLKEEDVVGASLDMANLFAHDVKALQLWLRCRGDSLKGCVTKAKCVARLVNVI